MKYDGKIMKTLNQKAKELKVGIDLPADNRGIRRKDLKLAIKVMETTKPITDEIKINRQFQGGKKKRLKKEWLNRQNLKAKIIENKEKG